MAIEIRYGEGESFHIEPGKEARVTDFSKLSPTALDDPAAAVAAALDHPLDFPALSESVVPGDQVVIALAADVPQSSVLLQGTIQSLLNTGRIEPEDITLLVSNRDEKTQADYMSALPASVASQIHFVRHVVDDPDQLAFLAASQDGQPIYLNRHLCDADVVIPVGVIQNEDSLGYLGVGGTLYPSFADRATQERFHAPSTSRHEALRRKRLAESTEVAWLLGIQLVIGLLPGQGDEILEVLAGEATAVSREGQRRSRVVWQHELSEPSMLVVAALEGGRGIQTWQHVARALYAAEPILAEAGTLILCTALRDRPGKSLRRLAQHKSAEEIQHDIQRDRCEDAQAASLLCRMRERTRIYLLSQLPAETVEDLGMGYVATAEDVSRLAAQADSCVLLGNADRHQLRLNPTGSPA